MFILYLTLKQETSLDWDLFFFFLQLQNACVFIYHTQTGIVTQHFWHDSVAYKVVGVAQCFIISL